MNKYSCLNGIIRFFKAGVGACASQDCRDRLFQVMMECTEASFVTDLTLKILYICSFVYYLALIQIILSRRSLKSIISNSLG